MIRASTLATLCVVAQACTTSFDCSLNGLCNAGVCACDTPWGGAACETLTFAVTPAAGKNLWVGAGTSENLNTWNGPIVQSVATGKYHLFNPVYEHASLWNVIYYAHGVADNVEGPWDWTSMPNITSTEINPAALVFPNASTGEMVYSLWIGGDILVAADPAGPFVSYARNPLPGNTATAYYKGNLYAMNQGNKIQTATSLAGPWTPFSTITHPAGMPYTVEDPYMWFDNAGNIHVINHAYNTGQRTNCTTSWVSSHSFSTDGTVWGHTDQPYTHVVNFDDGTSHAFCTLERPSLVFDATGTLKWLHNAADLVTEDGGCPNRGKGCVCVRDGSFAALPRDMDRLTASPYPHLRPQRLQVRGPRGHAAHQARRVRERRSARALQRLPSLWTGLC